MTWLEPRRRHRTRRWRVVRAAPLNDGYVQLQWRWNDPGDDRLPMLGLFARVRGDRWRLVALTSPKQAAELAWGVLQGIQQQCRKFGLPDPIDFNVLHPEDDGDNPNPTPQPTPPGDEPD